MVAGILYCVPSAMACAHTTRRSVTRTPTWWRHAHVRTYLQRAAHDFPTPGFGEACNDSGLTEGRHSTDFLAHCCHDAIA